VRFLPYFNSELNHPFERQTRAYHIHERLIDADFLQRAHHRTDPTAGQQAFANL